MKNKFKNAFKFYNNDINKFILLLRKGVYSWENMAHWENLNQTTLPEQEEFYSNLHGKKVFKDFEIKNLSKYHDLHLKTDTLISDHVFENFREICLNVYE